MEQISFCWEVIVLPLFFSHKNSVYFKHISLCLDLFSVKCNPILNNFITKYDSRIKHWQTIDRQLGPIQALLFVFRDIISAFSL